MKGSGRCETSRPPATTLLHVGDRACVGCASQSEERLTFIDFFFAAHVLFLVDGTRRSAVDDRRTAWRGCEFWQRVPDREMFPQGQQ